MTCVNQRSKRHAWSSWRTSDVFTSEGLSVLDDLCLGKNLSRFKGTGEMFNQKSPQVKRLLALDITWHHLTLYLAKLQLDSISPRTVIPLFPSPWAFRPGLSDVKTEVSAHTFARTCCDRTEQTRDSRHMPTSTGLPEHRTSIWSRKFGESLDWRFLRERQGNHCHFAGCSLHVTVGTLECVASRYKMLQTRLLKTIEMFSQCFMHVAIICHPQGPPCLANV